MIRVIDNAGTVLVRTRDAYDRERWYTLKRHPAPPRGERVLIDADDVLPRYTREQLTERGIEVVGERAARPQRYAPEVLHRRADAATAP